MARLVRLHGEHVAPSKKEFALLRALAADPALARAHARGARLRGGWGYRKNEGERHGCRISRRWVERRLSPAAPLAGPRPAEPRERLTGTLPGSAKGSAGGDWLVVNIRGDRRIQGANRSQNRRRRD
jgi:hypothetical protein